MSFDGFALLTVHPQFPKNSRTQTVSKCARIDLAQKDLPKLSVIVRMFLEYNILFNTYCRSGMILPDMQHIL